MLKKRFKINSLSNKKENTKDFNNKISINNFKENLDKVENSHKILLNKIRTNSITGRSKKKSKFFIKINLKKRIRLKPNINISQKDENNKDNTNSTLNFKNEKYKNKSCDNIILHYYNFNEAKNEINKQNLLKEKLNINNEIINSIPLNIEYFKKLTKNSFIKKCLENKKRKNINKNNKYDYYKNIFTYSERFYHNNSKKNIRYLLNNNGSVKYDKEDINSNSMISFFNNENIKNNVSCENILNNKTNTKYKKENILNNKTHKEYSKTKDNFLISTYEDKKINLFKQSINNINKNQKENENEKIQKKIFLKDKQEFFIYTNKHKNINKNEDIIKFIQNNNDSKENEKVIQNDNSTKNTNEIFSKIKRLSKIHLNNKYERDSLNNIFYNGNNNININKSISQKDLIDNINKSNKLVKLNLKNILRNEKRKDRNHSLRDENFSNYINSQNSFSVMQTNNIKDINKKNNDKNSNTNKTNIKNKSNKTDRINLLKKIKKLNNKPISKLNHLDKENEDIKEELLLYKRKKKRFNTVSFLSKKFKNLLKFNFKENVNVEFNDHSNKLELQNLKNIINEENIRINKRLFLRHKSITEIYLQLFFKNNENKKDEHVNLFKFHKTKFRKRKTKHEITFKEFIKKEEENIESRKESEDDEEKKSAWEERFDLFKKYVHKLKEMSNEEFMEDTFRFIKKEE